jgi:hypothetical protein
LENRITKYADMVHEKCVKLGQPLNGITWEEAETTLDITFSEHYAFQNEQSRAFASGRINQDEATTVYQALGEVWSEGNGGFREGVDYALKLAITTMVGELLEKRHKVRV